MFPETSSTARPALLKQGKPRSRGYRTVETSGNSGVIYYLVREAKARVQIDKQPSLPLRDGRFRVRRC
jgi:hypothetical protein